MFPLSNQSLLVNRSNIRLTKIDESKIASIKEGEVLLQVNEFALTANNITYAAIGEMLQYWNFFPTDKDGFGIVPVWGYATVIDSKKEEIKKGTKLYGYLPMSKYFVASPGKLTPFGFRDMATHRQKNAAIYNNYEFVSKEQDNHPAKLYVPIIRPLFTTSFLLYHFFKDENFKGAKRILLTSASSKTAMGLASMLATTRKTDNVVIAGMTSDRNKKFVLDTSLYDEIYVYDDPKQIPIEKTIIADFAGNKELLSKVEAHLGDELIFISAIGLTDWEGNRSQTSLPKTKMFFAPTYAEIKLKEWGMAKGMKMIKDEMMAFIQTIQSQVFIQQHNGIEELQNLYTELADGNLNPAKGYIITPAQEL